MDTLDLFIDEQKAQMIADLMLGRAGLTETQRKRLRNVTQQGYAAIPGTGPAGETCGSCKHIVRTRTWRKCSLMRSYWTGGLGTDIHARTPACKRWEKS